MKISRNKLVISFIGEEESIRKMIDRATFFVAYGQICFDETESRLKAEQTCSYSELDWDDVFKKSWNSCKRQSYELTGHGMKL